MICAWTRPSCRAAATHLVTCRLSGGVVRREMCEEHAETLALWAAQDGYSRGIVSGLIVTEPLQLQEKAA